MTGTLQGWKADPFGRFEQRYFSAGSPTTLVRTGRVETRDEPGSRKDRPDTGRDASPPRASLVLRRRLYERRRHRVLAPLTLVTAMLAPFAVWEVLVPTNRDRVLSAAAIAGVTAALAILMRMFRAPQSGGRDAVEPSRRPQRFVDEF